MNLDPLTARGAYTPPLVPMLGLEATVASTAITLADDVDVLTNDANLRIGPCRWQPRDGVYPTAGDACAVIQTNDGHNVLLWWKPAAAISPGVLGDITMGKLTAYSAATPASATFNQTNWLRSDKNTPTVFIGSADPTGAYAPTDYSGALRFNGAGVAWGDLAYYPNAVDGQFKLFRDGTVVGGTPAGLKVGSLYTSFVSPAVPSSPWLGIAGAALASGAAANGRVEMWDRLSLDTTHAFGSFTDPGSGGIFASGQILANGLANIAGDVYGGAFVRSRDATANATILGWNGSGIAPAIAFGAAYDAYIGRIAAGIVGTTGILQAGSTVIAKMGNHPTYGTAYSGLWSNVGAADKDYSVLMDGQNTYLNAPLAGGQMFFRFANTSAMTLTASILSFGAISLARPVVTSLPGVPVDGQEILFLADATNGVLWHLRYRAASASAFKWEAVGDQQPLTAEFNTQEATTTNPPGGVFFGTATVTQIAVPLAGDYLIEAEANIFDGSAATYVAIAISINGSTPNIGETSYTQVPTANITGFTHIGPIRRNGLAITNAIKPLFTSGAGTCNVQTRHMAVRPLRVG